jgi:phospholipase/carboxylesterase
VLRVAPLLAAVIAAACPGAKPAQSSSGLDAATLRFVYRAPTGTVAAGLHDLTPQRVDARLYVPASYRADRATPLIVLLHGAGQSADEWMEPSLFPVYEKQSAVILSVQSTGRTWDVLTGGFGPDVERIDAAITATLARVNVDSSRMAFGGFSDGASYALTLGVANGTRFKALLAFAPGFMDPPARRGKPRVYLAHGTNDQILPIAVTARVVWGDLQSDGYDVKYTEFAGRHGIYLERVTEALTWFAALP